ncbi:hypothetical protein [Sediminibacterium sp. TEGAF015]|uniref:hypothetical protein n=1 Tax=Sediminibacterium sp. TEGAF015 TaxID=575378 RepID=UPI0021FA1FD7|nr:hypothetical protein [Sediminibacterium sp. TEGAF015]BDQ12080.1 hypothetical protein TEGAF0_12970 [Sediminibacterium sp. TEGAF015]
MNNQFNIHDEREQNKIGLETYFLDKTNMFDIAIDKLIDKLKTGILKSQDQFDGWNKLQETDPERYAELVEQAERYEISINHQQYETFLDIIYNEEQLLSLVEMKVIYAFKFLEINIKKLLRAAFSLQSTKDFYKWDNLIKFLKDKNIDAKTLNSYFEITQLKNVNNAIKHSDDYETSLSSIQEFKNSDKITYNKIDHFYNRIKDKPNIFLQELISAIYKELYEFDDKKIGEIAKLFVLRMNQEDAIKLTKKINEHYD